MENLGPHSELFGFGIDFHGAGTDDTAFPPAPGHKGGMACHTASGS